MNLRKRLAFIIFGFILSFSLAFLSFNLTTKKVYSQESPDFSVSSGKTSSSAAGAVIPFTSFDEPFINIRPAGSKSGQADVFLYQSDKNTLLKYLIHDKDNKQINKNIDTSKLQLINNQQVLLTSNQNTRVSLPLEDSGIYLVQVKFNGTTGNNFLVRSKTGVLTKEGDKQYIFWGQNYKTGKSIDKGRITLYSLLDSQKELASADFDGDGIAKTNLLADADLAVFTLDEDIAIIPINLHSLNNSYNYRSFNQKENNIKYFIFTDRPIYKPGDTVYFKAVLRDDDDARYSITKGTARIKIYRGYSKSDEDTLISSDFPISEDGTISGQYILSEDAPTGEYEINIQANPTNNSYGYATFNVEYYRKPEYSIDLKAQKNELIAGDKSSVDISGEYFFGQTLAYQNITYNIFSGNYYQYEYPSQGYKNLNDDYQYGFWGRAQVAKGGLVLDQNGRAKINFEAKIPQNSGETNSYNEPPAGRNQIFSIEAEINDGSGNPSFARKNILVYAGEFDIFRKEGSSLAKINEQINLPLILVPHFKANVANIAVKASIHRTSWIPFQEVGKKYLSYRKEEEDLPNINPVKTDRDGNTTISFTPQKTGSYKITVEGEDNRNNPVINSFYFYVTSDKEFYSIDNYQGSHITITADKTLYEPTDTAKLTISSDIPDRDIFLSLERNRVDRIYIIHLQGKSQTLDIPLVSTDMPNIFASASSFTTTDLSQSYANLIVSVENKKLTIELKPNKERYGPSENVELDIYSKDSTGNPVSANTAVWAVDKAIYEITDQRRENIFNAFWSERYQSTPQSNSLQGIGTDFGGMGGCFSKDTQILMADGSQKTIDSIKPGDEILTKQSDASTKLVKTKVKSITKKQDDGYLIINGGLKVTPDHKIWINKTWKEASVAQIGDTLESFDGKLITINSIEWQNKIVDVYNLETEKHTFFADSIYVHNQKGGSNVRVNFKDTAYWNPQVKTDSKGHTQIHFKLPDNLTTWVISGVGATPQTIVGESKKEIIVQKDIFLRPVLPNLLRVGDTAFISAITHNYTDKNQTVTISLSTDDLKIDSIKEQEVNIQKGLSQQIFWKVEAVKEIPQAKLTFNLTSKSSNNLSDTIIAQIPIRAFGFVSKNVKTAEGSVDFPVNLNAQSDKTKTKITLSLSPTLLEPLISGMKYLLNYPYGCVEQITSRLVPALIAKSNPQLLNQLEEKNVDKIISQSLAKLDNLSVGGWSWWNDSKANYFVSAYVVENLVDAKKMGFKLSNQLIHSADYFLGQETIYDQSTQNHISIMASENIARNYALSLTDIKKAKPIKPEEMEGLTPDYVSLAVLTNLNLDIKDPDVNGLNKLLLMAKLQGDDVYFDEGKKEDFGSKEASTALAIRVMIQAGLGEQYLAPAVRYLLRHREATYFANTYATSQVLKALTAYMKVTKELTPDISYTVSLDGKQFNKGDFTSAENQLIQTQIPLDTIKESSILNINKSGQGQLYSTLNIEEFITDPNPAPENNGFDIKREYINEKTGKKDIAVGDLVEVRLTVNSEVSDLYALINDELPSGLVPVNSSFKNEQGSFSATPNSGPTILENPTYISNMEPTENGMIISLYKISEGVKTYSYKARAVSAGVFRSPPATIELMYSPKVNGRSKSDILQISAFQKTKTTANKQYILLASGILILAGVGIIVIKKRMKT